MPALQAFHEEEAFLNARMTQKVFLPNLKALHTFDMEDVGELLENNAHECFGGKIPRTNWKQMLPQLKPSDQQYATDRFCWRSFLAWFPI